MQPHPSGSRRRQRHGAPMRALVIVRAIQPLMRLRTMLPPAITASDDLHHLSSRSGPLVPVCYWRNPAQGSILYAEALSKGRALQKSMLLGLSLIFAATAGLEASASQLLHPAKTPAKHCSRGCANAVFELIHSYK